MDAINCRRKELLVFSLNPSASEYHRTRQDVIVRGTPDGDFCYPAGTGFAG